jgi:purine-binding chemotaxis protein CheW
MNDLDTGLALICRVRTRLCALPLAHVVETMRPLPVSRLSNVPDFVSGLAIVRGVPTAVVDAARLLGEEDTCPSRFVALRVSDRRVALAVDDVLGVRRIPVGCVHDLPPLLANADQADISAIGALDAELLLVLGTTRLVPNELWAALDADGSRA